MYSELGTKMLTPSHLVGTAAAASVALRRGQRAERESDVLSALQPGLCPKRLTPECRLIPTAWPRDGLLWFPSGFTEDFSPDLVF